MTYVAYLAQKIAFILDFNSVRAPSDEDRCGGEDSPQEGNPGQRSASASAGEILPSHGG